MSRVAKSPIEIPGGVKITVDNGIIKVKGGKGELELTLHDSVELAQEENVINISSKDEKSWAMAGTTRSLINNMVVGVSQGFEKKLELVGVGYRAKASGKTLNLTLGFSHPVDYTLPEGITAETPSQTEIVIKGADKQVVGQVASEIRAFRPPEPYKGKGVRYSDEYVRRKEAKKK
jgi:large subunit ribosomal protein L6